MSRGLDVNQDCSSKRQCLLENGITFVGRYYGHSKAEPLTRVEADALSAAGLFIVAVWESGFPTRPGYFSRARGVMDGASAYHYAQDTIGQPANTPIYFTVDYDATSADIARVIVPYFQGVQASFHTISEGNPVYAVGVYGSGLVCSRLRSAGLAEYSWLALASAWQGFSAYHDWNIKQSLSHSVCGLDVDGDETRENGGGFKIA